MKKGSIRSKLMHSYIKLLAVAIITLVVCSWIVLGVSLESQARDVLRNAVLLVDGKLENVVRSISGGTDAALLSLNQIDKVLYSGATSEEEFRRYNAITLNLYLLKQIFRELDSAVFVGQDGTVYIGDAEREHRFAQEFNYSRHSVLEENYGMTVCFGLCREDGISLEEGNPVLLVGKLTRLITSGQQLGYLYFAVQESSLSELYRGASVTPGTEILICDADGYTLSSSNRERVSVSLEPELCYDQIELRLTDGMLWVCYRTELESISADIVCRAPFHELYGSVIRMFLVILLVGLFSLGAAVWLSRRLSHRLVDPIESLSISTMRIMEGHLDERCGVDSNDEIGVLAGNFNTMLDQLSELIDLVRQEQREKAEKEMKLLQNRIQPHFLYNTLNTIFTLCAMNRPEEAGKAAKMTADYYRLMLSDGSDIVPIRDELKNAACFFEISKMWLGNRFRYEILCPHDLEEFRIPKMTLQPIAENAIQHAIPQCSAGVLRITVERRGEDVVIRVTDNGTGMSPKLCEDVLRGDTPGYGLKNVRERLELYGKDKIQFHIWSKLGEGTVVELVLRAEAASQEQEGADARSYDC